MSGRLPVPPIRIPGPKLDQMTGWIKKMQAHPNYEAIRQKYRILGNKSNPQKFRVERRGFFLNWAFVRGGCSVDLLDDAKAIMYRAIASELKVKSGSDEWLPVVLKEDLGKNDLS